MRPRGGTGAAARRGPHRRNRDPGTYLLAALLDVDAAEALNPAFLERVVNDAIPLTIAPRETKTQDIRIK